MNPDQNALTTRPHIILITGNMAAGKSSVAQALTERLTRSVHLRGDLFRRMIVHGQADMSFDLPEEAQQQLDLRYRIAAAVAPLYLQAGFTVVYQDIIVGPALAEVISYYAAHPLSVFVLCPRPEAIAAREAARNKTGYTNHAEILEFDRVLRQETPRLGCWLDTSALSVAETVDLLLQHLPQAAVTPDDAEE